MRIAATKTSKRPAAAVKLHAETPKSKALAKR